MDTQKHGTKGVYVYTYIDRHIFLILSHLFFLFQPLSLDLEDEDVSDSGSETSIDEGVDLEE